MGDRLSAERACKDPNPIIDGRKANVNLAILGAKPRGNITQGKVARQCHERASSQLCNVWFPQILTSHDGYINN